jgi:hyperosmotically inducible protein
MKMKHDTVRTLGALAVFFLALCVLPFASATTITTPEAVRDRLEQKLQSDGLQNVSATVSDDSVILSGTVQTLADKLRVEKIARETKDAPVIIRGLALEDSHRAGDQIAADITKSIQTYFYYDAFEWVAGTLSNGEVTLTGWTRQPWRKDDYEKRVTDIPGVQKVVNQIRVLPVSMFDERLRVRVARLIYSHPTLSRYGVGAHPSIHIIVENGRVMLEGNVDVKSAQTVAGMLAHQSMAFKITNDLQLYSGS